jgi:hypothetical protein
MPNEIRRVISPMIDATPPSSSRSARVSSVRAALFPQPMSYPTPDGETYPLVRDAAADGWE